MTNSSNAQTIKGNLMLFLAATIWGFAFVAQRVGMNYVGPFTFNGVRFALGSLSLIPLILYFKDDSTNHTGNNQRPVNVLAAGLIAGVILFMGASLQQVGMIETSAGKAAFITGLYIVLVPILGIFLKHRTSLNTWVGAIIAAAGLYFLCVTEQFTISYYDLLELIGAFFWATHILVIDRYSGRVNTLKLAAIQFATCSVLSLITAGFTEQFSMSGLTQAIVPILYGGFFSVGIAYTLQIVGQKNAHPSHAAIILSMETVMAVIGGSLLLNERMEFRGLLGCGLMLTGMLLSQLQGFKKSENTAAQASSNSH